jgi:hypothetical protein
MLLILKEVSLFQIPPRLRMNRERRIGPRGLAD